MSGADQLAREVGPVERERRCALAFGRRRLRSSLGVAPVAAVFIGLDMGA